MAESSKTTTESTLLCPITHEIFKDPVLAEDGHTYERESIVQWVQNHGTSPLTRQPLNIDQLRPNFTVKNMVEEFRSKNFQFKLDVHIKKKGRRALFQAHGKTVWEAEWIGKDGAPICIMKIDGVKALKEASFFEAMTRHLYIVKTYGTVDESVGITSNSILLLQEFAPEGNLFELLQEQASVPDPNILCEMFVQISDAMVFLARNQIVHGDLACRNVLVFRYDANEPKNNLVKITDFGLSRGSSMYAPVGSASTTTLTIIPIRYAAPEVLSDGNNRSSYTEKSDMFSMGVLMWEGYSKGEMPWSNIENDNEVSRKVRNGERLKQPSKCSDAMWSLILKCMLQEPNDRSTFNELKHQLLGFMLNSVSLPDSVTTAVDTCAAITLSSSTSEDLFNETVDTLCSCEKKLVGIEKLLSRESSSLSSTSDDLKQYCNFLRYEIESVGKLELRMAIVGTMKAGKSTILNAIMGQDLLPSRNTAMTTLPTEILFSRHTKEPQLILTSELRTIIEQIGKELKLKSGEHNLETRLRNEEDLIKMMKNLSRNELLTLKATTYGNSNIVESLKYINDLIRISIMLNIENTIDSTWIPSLEVPLPHSLSIPHGKFIIIDTPGPNDRNLPAHLRQIVISQLQKATIILVAVEFIGSDSNDEAKLQEDIETIREYKDTDGPSYLYALINKIDQRIEDKHNSIEKTKDAVAMKYKIPLANVYEISAMNAMLSYLFLQEYEQLKKRLNVTHETLMNEMKSYKMFMHQALGQTWQQTAQYVDVNILPSIAEGLWKKSNYDSFLHHSLSVVSQHVMPICLTTALQKCHYYMQKCYEKVAIRKSCLDIDEKPLLETLNRMREDKQQLDQIRKNAEKDLDNYHIEIVAYVKGLFKDAENQSAHSVTDILSDKSTQYTDSYWKILLLGQDVLHFNTVKDADVFFETFFYSIKAVSEGIMHSVSQTMHEAINRRCFAFRHRLQLQTDESFQHIGMRLKGLLGFEVIPLQMSSNKLNIEHLSRALTQTEISNHRRLWYFLWLAKGVRKVKVNQLSRKQLEHNAIESLKENFKELEKHAVNEAKKQANAVFVSHFDAVNEYLWEQYNNIRAAIDDKTIERKTIEKKLKSTLGELNESKETLQKVLIKVKTNFEG